MTLRVKLKLLTANSRSRSKILLSKVAAGGTVKPHTPKAGLGLRLAKRTSEQAVEVTIFPDFLFLVSGLSRLLVIDRKLPLSLVFFWQLITITAKKLCENIYIY